MKITHIVIHYSATFSNQMVDAKLIDRWHKDRGWSGIGYHYVVRRDGVVETGRPENKIGAHVARQNTGKIGICWAGGLERSNPNTGVNNMTVDQETALVKLIKKLLVKYPNAEVVGHRDLAATQCPGFDVRAWWKRKSTTVQEILPVRTPVLEEELSWWQRLLKWFTPTK
jgi:N-acetyl-anhydromuramyl-L-alanine amidase AmpD